MIAILMLTVVEEAEKFVSEPDRSRWQMRLSDIYCARRP